ncbi:MAG: bacterial transcriptional activator domain-containing protein [Coriobacteriales bacterium]|nr:bacterial transcriptional activator domain-containing protein [Coriobacteriales bacterium]
MACSKLNNMLNRPQEKLRFLSHQYGRVRLNPNLVSSDVDLFIKLARQVINPKIDNSKRRECLERALQLYAGDVPCDHCRNDELQIERTRYRNLNLELLVKLCRLQHESGQSEQALELCQRGIELDPVREDLHYLKMQIELGLGKRVSALRSYLFCEQMLARELGVRPAQATRLLYRNTAESAALPGSVIE